MTNSTFQSLADHFREISLLETTQATLEWDERTGLPAKAGGYRADQIELLSGLTHQKRTDPKIGDWLEDLSNSKSSLNDDQRASVEKLKRNFDRDRKLPQDLVQSITKATVLGQQAWSSARKADRFSDFEKQLLEIVNLQRQKAELLIEPNQSPYDALMDFYEPGATTATLKPVFDDLLSQLSELVKQCQPHCGPSGKSLESEFPIEIQKQFSARISAAIGFDYKRGRLDETDHPFCTTLGPNDHRILTRYQANFFSAGLFGTLHEAGHGMYEQGLRTNWFGLPSGMYASLGIHESQSRLWENMVGRSEAFWRWCWPLAQSSFENFKNVELEQFVADLNRVSPSLIRVEADEVTYNLHIGIRFELERALIEGELEVKDLPAAWNSAYQRYLGITPPSDADGVLQDVHWSAGLFGYFPTYTLGNIFAAQFMVAIRNEIGDLDQLLAKGEFAPLLDWLRTNVHRHGQNLSSEELVQTATGSDVSSKPLVDYLKGKVLPLYQ